MRAALITVAKELSGDCFNACALQFNDFLIERTLNEDIWRQALRQNTQLRHSVALCILIDKSVTEIDTSTSVRVVAMLKTKKAPPQNNLSKTTWAKHCSAKQCVGEDPIKKTLYRNQTESSKYTKFLQRRNHDEPKTENIRTYAPKSHSAVTMNTFGRKPLPPELPGFWWEGRHILEDPIKKNIKTRITKYPTINTRWKISMYSLCTVC